MKFHTWDGYLKAIKYVSRVGIEPTIYDSVANSLSTAPRESSIITIRWFSFRLKSQIEIEQNLPSFRTIIIIGFKVYGVNLMSKQVFTNAAIVTIIKAYNLWAQETG